MQAFALTSNKHTHLVGGFYSEVALRNEKQKAQCILNTS